MKRLVVGLSICLLASCGTMSSVPSVGQLLDAPTQVTLDGQLVSVEANSVLDANLLHIEVALQGSTRALPPLKVRELYVVTNNGVWTTGPNNIAHKACTENCQVVNSSGPASGLQRGQGAQVIVSVEDSQGQRFFVRDAKVRVGFPQE